MNNKECCGIRVCIGWDKKTILMNLKKVEALETIDSLVMQGKVYIVHLIKNEAFPEGEEAIVGDSEEYITLPVFKHKLLG